MKKTITKNKKYKNKINYIKKKILKKIQKIKIKK